MWQVSFFKRLACFESLKIGRFSAKSLGRKNSISIMASFHFFFNLFFRHRDLCLVLDTLKLTLSHTSFLAIRSSWSFLYRRINNEKKSLLHSFLEEFFLCCSEKRIFSLFCLRHKRSPWLDWLKRASVLSRWEDFAGKIA